MISVLQAQTQILARPVSLKKEKIALNSSLKRVLAENLICDRDTPPFDRATMDGIAVCLRKEIANKNSLADLKILKFFFGLEQFHYL